MHFEYLWEACADCLCFRFIWECVEFRHLVLEPLVYHLSLTALLGRIHQKWTLAYHSFHFTVDNMHFSASSAKYWLLFFKISHSAVLLCLIDVLFSCLKFSCCSKVMRELWTPLQGGHWWRLFVITPAVTVDCHCFCDKYFVNALWNADLIVVHSNIFVKCCKHFWVLCN